MPEFPTISDTRLVCVSYLAAAKPPSHSYEEFARATVLERGGRGGGARCLLYYRWGCQLAGCGRLVTRAEVGRVGEGWGGMARDGEGWGEMAGDGERWEGVK